MAIVSNVSPHCVVPFGGKTDVTGTNPLAYGIPSNGHPFIFDAATAKYAWGTIRLARESGQHLPDNAFADEAGNITTDPYVATSVLSFGDFKGYAINLLMDVMTGCMIWCKSGLDTTEDERASIGTFVIIIDPSAFVDISEFKKSTAKLAQDIMAVTPVDPAQPVRIPGFRGAEQRERLLQEGVIEIEAADWQKFMTAYTATVQ